MTARTSSGTGDGACSRRHALATFGAAASALACAPVTAAGAAEGAMAALPADLAHALDAFVRATIDSDTAALADLVTDDYLLVNSDATTQGKRSYLADFEAPGFRIDPFEIAEPTHRIYGDAAVTGGIMALGWTQDGRHQTRRLRIAHVWIRQERRWRIVYTQLTRIPDQAGKAL